jgi:hypothetical protein
MFNETQFFVAIHRENRFICKRDLSPLHEQSSKPG